MKKKVLSALLIAAMTATMFAGCGDNSTSDDANTQGGDVTDESQATIPDDVDYGSGTITIWVADEVVELTQQKAEEFIAEKGVDYTVTVESVGEGDAASNMITDVEGGADIFGFAQDQMARLVAAGALQTLTGTGFDTTIAEINDEPSVAAATVGDEIYAFPMTSDNGYFLYYDKSVVTDPTSLEKIAEDCAAAGKNFYFEINSGWYQPAFFFGTGGTITYESDSKGNFTAANVDIANEQGVVALREIIDLVNSSSFQNGSSLSSASDVGAIVDGTWDSSAAKEIFGDNFACAKLPSFVGSDGNTYQLGAFSGFKLLGVKPQEEEGKAVLCCELATYLTSEEVQLARYEANGWGPSNVNAQQDSAVQADEALSALGEQIALDVTIPQGQYPNDFWTLATALGDDIIAGNVTASMSDDELLAILQDFQDTCISYAE